MVRRLFLWGAPVLTVAALLLAPSASQAQYRGGWGGGRSGGWGGYNGGWGGYNSGWGGGWRGGWGGNYGGWGGYNPSYSYGWGGYNYPSYSSYYYPSSSYYSSGYYYPSYSSGYYSYPSYTTGAYYTSGTPSSSGYQSFYPSEGTDNNRAFVRVEVPANAEIWFEGKETKKTEQGGPDRLFVTPPLENNNKEYYYEVRARWMENGQEVDRTKRVDVRPGGQSFLSFMGNADDTSRTTNQRTTEPQPPATTPVPDTTRPRPDTTPTTPTTPRPGTTDTGANRRPDTTPTTPTTPRPGTTDTGANRPTNPQTETPPAPPASTTPRPGTPGSPTAPGGTGRP